MKLKIEPLQHTNDKRVWWKPQLDQQEFLINNNLIITRVGYDLLKGRDGGLEGEGE
jgi:hypothetical protein